MDKNKKKSKIEIKTHDRNWYKSKCYAVIQKRTHGTFSILPVLTRTGIEGKITFYSTIINIIKLFNLKKSFFDDQHFISSLICSHSYTGSFTIHYTPINLRNRSKKTKRKIIKKAKKKLSKIKFSSPFFSINLWIVFVIS